MEVCRCRHERGREVARNAVAGGAGEVVFAAEKFRETRSRSTGRETEENAESLLACAGADV